VIYDDDVDEWATFVQARDRHGAQLRRRNSMRTETRTPTEVVVDQITYMRRTTGTTA
jgi:hypothetical protein